MAHAHVPAGSAPLSTVPGLPFYQYKALPSETHIRRFILDPGSHEDPLSGTIEVIDLAKASLYPYEAISYVWGSEVLDNWILVDGQQLPITENLAMSLRQARYSSTHCALWVDSICINQSDAQEKGHQVRRMGHIYKQAQRTLICLGCDNQQDARVASDLIQDVRAMMDRVFTDPSFSWKLDAFPWPEPDSPLLTPARWDTADMLYEHPWFSRGWTIQEVALSRNALILWAGSKIPWVHLITTYFWYMRRARPNLPKLPTSEINMIHQNHAIRSNRQILEELITLWGRPHYMLSGGLATLTTLDWARRLQLTDAKDRIYAFMEIPTLDGAMQALQLEPDYSTNTSHLDIYRDFAIAYLEKTRDLDLLRYAVAAPTTEHSPLDACTLPSWIPHWGAGNIPNIVINRGREKVTLNPDSPEFTIQDNGSALRVKAIIFDAIAYVAGVPSLDMDWKNLQDVLKYVIAGWRDISRKSAEHTGPHHDRLAQAQAFIGIICCDSVLGDEQEWAKSTLAFARLLEADTADRLVQDYLQDSHVQRIMKLLITSRGTLRPAIFDRGQYGTVPFASRKGDVCAIIFGTSAPLIVRKVAGDGHRYTLVGVAYVQSRKWCDEFETPFPLGYDDTTEDWKDLHIPTQEILLC